MVEEIVQNTLDGSERTINIFTESHAIFDLKNVSSVQFNGQNITKNGLVAIQPKRIPEQNKEQPPVEKESDKKDSIWTNFQLNPKPNPPTQKNPPSKPE